MIGAQSKRLGQHVSSLLRALQPITIPVETHEYFDAVAQVQTALYSETVRPSDFSLSYNGVSYDRKNQLVFDPDWSSQKEIAWVRDQLQISGTGDESQEERNAANPALATVFEEQVGQVATLNESTAMEHFGEAARVSCGAGKSYQELYQTSKSALEFVVTELDRPETTQSLALQFQLQAALGPIGSDPISGHSAVPPNQRTPLIVTQQSWRTSVPSVAQMLNTLESHMIGSVMVGLHPSGKHVMMSLKSYSLYVHSSAASKDSPPVYVADSTVMPDMHSVCAALCRTVPQLSSLNILHRLVDDPNSCAQIHGHLREELTKV